VLVAAILKAAEEQINSKGNSFYPYHSEGNNMPKKLFSLIAQVWVKDGTR